MLCRGHAPFPPVCDWAAELAKRSSFPSNDIPDGLKNYRVETGLAKPTETPPPPSDNHAATPPPSSDNHAVTSPPPSDNRAATPPSSSDHHRIVTPPPPSGNHTATPPIDLQPIVESISETAHGEEEEVDELVDEDASMGLENTPASTKSASPAADDDLPAAPAPKRRKMQVYVEVPPRKLASKDPAVRSHRRSTGVKMPKTSTTLKALRPGDLRDFYVEEDSKVDRKMIPQWQGEVCTTSFASIGDPFSCDVSRASNVL
jgi:hypothetical protein